VHYQKQNQESKLMKSNSLMKVVLPVILGILFSFNTSCKRVCDGVECKNGGERFIEDKECFCECPSAYTGERCEVVICSGVDCLNGGKNVINGGICSCDCPDGYAGKYCEINLCEGITCLNGGTKVTTDGDCYCNCPLGFEGVNCEIDIKTRYIGAYNVAQSICFTDTTSYNIVITSISNTEFSIGNLYKAELPTKAVLQPNGNLIINKQPFTNGNTISGNVEVINDITLKITFAVSTGSNDDNCSGFFTKIN